MRLKLFCLFLLIFGSVAAELQGPPDTENESKSTVTEKQSKSNDRKADEEHTESIYKDIDESDSDEKTLEALLQEELGFHGSAIKIVKAPDLHQEKEAQKVSDMLSTLVSSHAKLIKKFESEIEEIDGSIAALSTEEEEPKVQTPEEIEAETLYESAMLILNKTRSDKAAGFAVLQQAASKGHVRAQAEVAWCQLLGHPVEHDFEAAKETFIRLADQGLAEAHMVSKRNFHTEKFKKSLSFD